jgi:uncharacterized protein YecT (DUF1311 family)
MRQSMRHKSYHYSVILFLFTYFLCISATAIAGKYTYLIRYNLLKTDSSLNYTYRKFKSLLAPNEKIMLIEQQRKWVRKRDDKCHIADIPGSGPKWVDAIFDTSPQKAQCADYISRERIRELTRLIYIRRYKDAKIYPPYPDVWGRITLNKKNLPAEHLTPIPFKNGDIFLVYKKENKKPQWDKKPRHIVTKPCDEWTQLAYTEFFSGKEYLITCGEYNSYRDVIVDKNKLKKSRRIFTIDRYKYRKMSINRRQCHDPFTNYIQVKNIKSGKIKSNWIVLAVRKKPKLENIIGQCDEEETVSVNVESQRVGLYKLDDKTFLMYLRTPYSITIRFDKNFKTKLSYQKYGIFLVKAKEIWRVTQDLGYIDYNEAVLLYLFKKFPNNAFLKDCCEK